MKRILSFVFTIFIIISLVGCSSSSFDPVTFYYCRKSDAYQYFEADGVITSEERDLTGHGNDLQYLVALYLAGPLDEDLISPFPRKTRLLEAENDPNSVQIELTDLGSSMTDAEFSLAAVCLAKTCISFADVTEATIRSGARTITINEKNVILADIATTEYAEGE